ncbi:alpha/beta fold hydrolase [Marinactinospora rubrisoli]|uniref:Alpha/beta fold hydrolase n=1 Tax=Marinactinospora rubrisoli TaxID=2715399 RepID=A0ABW2KJX1_9ACTN
MTSGISAPSSDPAAEEPLWHRVGGPTRPAETAHGPGRPPVLLLHGFGSTADLNWGLTGWLRALHGGGLRTIAPDLPGHGRSPRPRSPERYTPGRLVEDVLRLLDALAEPRVDVLGYSMGARLAWELAAGHPDRVRRAVLGGFGPAALPGRNPATGGAGDGPFDAVFRAAAALPVNDPDVLAACVRGQTAHPFTADPLPAGVPVLFAFGEHDDLAAGAETLAARLPAARVVRIPERDHRTAVSAAGFKSAALEFLSARSLATGRDRAGATGAADA